MSKYFKEETESFVSGILRQALGGLADKIIHAATNRILEYQLQLYKDNIYTKSFFHRSKPVLLYDFYMPLNLETFTYRKYDEISTTSTESCSVLFKENKNIAVIGTAGSGKSTLVKHLIVDTIKSNFAIPILIELRELNRADYSGDLLKYISVEIFDYYKIGNKENIVDSALFKGGFLFILDGYDELSQNSLSKATSLIQKFTVKYGKNYFLITSRPFTNIESLKSFTNYQIKGLTVPEQDELIKKLLKDNNFVQERIIKEKSKKENSSYLTFLQNPLLLSLFIITFEYHPTLPKKKSLFYEKVFQTLYEKHNSITKVNFNAEFYSKLSEDEFRIVIELFSFISYFQNLYEFTSNDIRKILNEVKRKYSVLDLDSSLFTKDALENVCIWFNDGNYYTFAHRSLQEYFTVKQILKLDSATKTDVYGYLDKFFTENYNLIELLAEEPDLDYYRKLIIPHIRSIIVNHFEEIDGHSKNIDKLEKAYSEFTHLIDIDLSLSSIFKDFCNVYADEDFSKHPLMIEHANKYNIDTITNILIINKYYGALEKLVNNLTERTVLQNERIMDFTFRIEGKNKL